MAVDYTTDYSTSSNGFGIDFGPIHLRVGGGAAAGAPATTPAPTSGLVWVVVAIAAYLILK